MMDWIADTWQGFVDFLQEILVMILTFIRDLALTIFELIMDGVVYMFNSITPPEFLTNDLSTLTNALPTDILYFLNMSGLSAGLAIYGAGVTFRLLRKLFTLGQW